MKRVRVFEEIEGAWEIWEYDVPDDTTIDNIGEVSVDNGVLIDSGRKASYVTKVEDVS